MRESCYRVGSEPDDAQRRTIWCCGDQGVPWTCSASGRCTGLLVSAADKLQNARSVVADLRTVGDAVWDRFSASREESLWYYGALVDVFRANPAHWPGLIGELARTVRETECISA